MVEHGLLDLVMADEDQPSTRTARVDTELLRLARIVCAHTPGRNGKQLKLTDYLDSILRPHITKDYQATMKRVAKEAAKDKED